MNIKLKRLRKERNLTQKQVSTALGISLSCYSNYEQGTREPSLGMINRLCKFFDVTADYLLGFDD